VRRLRQPGAELLDQPRFAEAGLAGDQRELPVAAARALQELGSSSAVVCTPNSYVGAIATYRAAGFQQLTERRDLCRNA